MTDKYDRGPECDGVDPYSVGDYGRLDDGVGTEVNPEGLAVAVYRYNRWHFACDEIDRLRGLLAELPGMVRGMARDADTFPLADHDYALDHAAGAIEARIREVG